MVHRIHSPLTACICPWLGGFFFLELISWKQLPAAGHEADESGEAEPKQYAETR